MTASTQAPAAAGGRIRRLPRFSLVALVVVLAACRAEQRTTGTGDHGGTLVISAAPGGGALVSATWPMRGPCAG